VAPPDFRNESLADIAAALPDFRFAPGGTLITLDGDPSAS
jgi:hypothetical protein